MCVAYYLPLDTPVHEVAAALITDIYRWGRTWAHSWERWMVWCLGRCLFLAFRMPDVW